MQRSMSLIRLGQRECGRWRACMKLARASISPMKVQVATEGSSTNPPRANHTLSPHTTPVRLGLNELSAYAASVMSYVGRLLAAVFGGRYPEAASLRYLE